MKHFVQRGLVLLGASAISLGLTGPAFASTPRSPHDSGIVQRQSADLSNSTDQKAVAVAPAVQFAPAANVGVLNFGGHKIRQANRNSSDAQAANFNATKQSVSQRQFGKAKVKHDRKPTENNRKHGKHECRPVKHDGRHDGKPHGKPHGKPDRHPRKHGGSVSQRQDADVSNSTQQKAVAVAPAVQIAPAVNVGVLNFGGQKIDQANSNSSNAGAINVNSTDQEVSQSQLGDA